MIVVENGEPELVVMSFKEYEKIMGASTLASPSRTLSFTKSIPTERADLGEDIEKETEVVAPMTADYHINRPLRLEDIRLEDLPL